MTINDFFSLKVLDVVVIGFIVFMMNLATYGYIQMKQRRKNRLMMEEFLSHIHKKIQTEEEFQDIVEKMRRDFGGDQFPKP